MGTTTDFAAVAALMGDPARAQILEALMDGRSLTASELARAAGVAPQTASSHLAKLNGAGLLASCVQGRYRYYRIASATVAHIIEQLWTLSDELAASRPGARRVFVGPRDPALRFARTCYDHLAGHLAIQIVDGLAVRGHLEISMEGASLNDSGVAYLRSLGIRLEEPSPRTSRMFCKPCLDWSERRPHLAGVVGAAICTMCFENGWVRRSAERRAVSLTPKGQQALNTSFGTLAPKLAGEKVMESAL
ncbi:MAG: winged helix-turn-helix domain-containing protein [Alsobacter sp.]